MLALEEKLELLVVARLTLRNYLKEYAIPAVKPTSPKLKEPGRTFVTLTSYGELRGCVGNVGQTKPLYQTVQENALHAAIHDFRFEPLTAEELDFITIEISVLSEPKPVSSLKEVKIGEHGLILHLGERQGVFLPEVAADNNWNLEQTLTHLCFKIGAPLDAWKSEAVRLSVFTTEKFKEIYE